MRGLGLLGSIAEASGPRHPMHFDENPDRKQTGIRPKARVVMTAVAPASLIQGRCAIAALSAREVASQYLRVGNFIRVAAQAFAVFHRLEAGLGSQTAFAAATESTGPALLDLTSAHYTSCRSRQCATSRVATYVSAGKANYPLT